MADVQALTDALAASAGARPGHIALVTPERSVTYGELHDHVLRLAAALSARGLTPGDRVVLWGENGWQWVVAYYAVLEAGAVVTPINLVSSRDEVRFAASNCAASMAIISHSRSELLPDGLDLPTLVYGSHDADDDGILEAILSHACSSQRSRVSGDDDLAMICYTSGTMGRPKGAMLTHRNVATNAVMLAHMHGRGPDDIIVSALPLPHVYGNAVLNSALMVGATVVLFPAFCAAAVLDTIETHRATVLDGVPTMYYYLLRTLDEQQRDLVSLRICAVGGQTIPVAKIEEVERRFGCPLIELWGMTELAGIGITHHYQRPHIPGSIGKAIPGVEARVVSVTQPATEMGVGEVGELVIRGPIVMAGYFANADATAATITPDGWLLTGDLVRRDKDGNFYIVDRKKDMIVTAGYNVYPAEIERVIAGHPDVSMVAVVGIPDEDKGEIAKAFVVPRAGSNLDPEALSSLCRQSLAAYKQPRRFAFVDDLPKTGSGKILRRALRDLEENNGVDTP